MKRKPVYEGKSERNGRRGSRAQLWRGSKQKAPREGQTPPRALVTSTGLGTAVRVCTPTGHWGLSGEANQAQILERYSSKSVRRRMCYCLVGCSGSPAKAYVLKGVNCTK